MNHSICDITHTFTSFAIDYFSTIINFIVTSSLYQAIKSYTTCDDVMNQSDHLPLFISIDIEVPTDTLDNSTVNPFSTVRAPRQLWDRADNTDRVKYRARLEHNLSLLHLPRDCMNCTDYCCTDYSHVASIQLFHDYLIELCLEASKVIPVAKKNPKSFHAGMSMLNSTSKHLNFGISFGRNAARLEMAKLLKL